MKGDRSLSPGQNNTFRLSLTNGAAHTCLASVTSKNFELKIFSGKDRIWSSRDCAKTLAAFDKKLATRAEVAWKMTWNGERSVKGKECKRGTDTPAAGTYWATAQLAGAKPVPAPHDRQLRSSPGPLRSLRSPDRRRPTRPPGPDRP